MGKPAEARDPSEKILLFHLLPIWISDVTLINCSCGAKLISSRKARELAELDPSVTATVLERRASLASVVLPMGGIFVWIFPVGFVWMAGAYYTARKRRGWIKIYTIALLVLSVLTSSVLFFPIRIGASIQRDP